MAEEEYNNHTVENHLQDVEHDVPRDDEEDEEDANAKEDEFSNMIGLEEVNEETTEQTLYHLGLHLEKLRRDSIRSSMRSSSQQSQQMSPGNGRHLSFSEWSSGRRKEGSQHKPQQGRSLNDKRKSFISKLRRIQSEKTPRARQQYISASQEQQQAAASMNHMESAAAASTAAQEHLPQGQPVVMQVSLGRVQVTPATADCSIFLEQQQQQQQTANAVIDSEQQCYDDDNGPFTLRTACVQTEPLSEGVAGTVTGTDTGATGSVTGQPSRRHMRLCTHCLEKYTSPRRQQITFLERKKFFESMS